MPNVVEARKFTCVNNEGSNNNKYWNITLYDDDTVCCEWGRVGRKQGDNCKQGGRRLFDSLIAEKTSDSRPKDKRYRENKTIESNVAIDVTSVKSGGNLRDVAKKQIVFSDCPITSKLIDELVAANAHDILKASGGSIKYDTSSAQFTTPQGIIVPDQVKQARDLLSELADAVADRQWAKVVNNRKFLEYLCLIPHDIGMRRADFEEMFPDLQSVQQENNLLDGLETSFNDIVAGKDKKPAKKKKKDDAPKVFNLKLAYVQDQNVFSRIKKKYHDTRKDMHVCAHLDVKNVYAVEIAVVKEAFDKACQRLTNKMELWHGTTTPNLLSILKSGLRIRPPQNARITGKMFGNGIYFAKDSTKSLNYSYGYWNGTRNERCFMFVADVLMGKYYTPDGPTHNLPKTGSDSTWAKSRESGVANDEMIVYKEDQYNLTYLVEFTKGGK